MSKPLVIAGMVNSYTGYGQHCLEVAKYFVKAGREVIVRPIHLWQDFDSKVPEWIWPYLRYEPQAWPWEMILYASYHVPTPGKHNVFFTMWETDRLHEQGKINMNQCQLVITPCHWNRDTFMAAGVNRPIELVPLGVNTETFRPAPMNMVGPCIFGAAGRLKHGTSRKGVNQVVALFQKAFPRETDVELQVKSFPDEKELQVPADKRIVVIQKYLAEEELARWYHGLTCFVSAARGEGWGLMQHQAMACGRPVMAPVYGGLKEFMGKDNSYSLPYRLVEADQNYKGWGKWAAVEEGAMIDTMREVYRNRQRAKELGEMAAATTNLLTWYNSNLKLEGALKKHGII